jgi:glycosyltransferase involved in cell wall biosynthesis
LFPKSDSFKDFQQWNLEKEKYILSVSRLVQHKEIHTLIEAFINLRGSNRISSDFKLVIVGGGAYTDKYVSRIKKMAQGRQDIILAGVQRGQKLAALYQNAYCFVQPSRTEGLSLALLEAMGAGLAPLVSDIPENLYVVTEYGKVFQTGDLPDLMDKLEYMINNPEKTKIMGEKACQLVKEKYNWNKIVDDIESVYDEVVMEKRKILGHRRGTWI